MIDPLTAFGLAANIVQFLDLGGQIVQTGYRAYSSAKGSSEDTIQLQKVTADLLHVTDRLTLPLAPEDATLSRPDASLENLGRQCRDLAKQLLGVLTELAIPPEGSFKGWQALRVAVKEKLTKKKEIESISGRLNTYRQQISTHLLAIMKYVSVFLLGAKKEDRPIDSKLNDQSTILKELRSLQQSPRLQADELSNLRDLRKELVEVLSSHKALLDRFRFWNTVTSVEKDSERTLMSKIVDHMQAISEKSSVLATENQILNSLYFPQMHERQETIKPTHFDTFTWIFDDDTTDFKSWLHHESGIFWVRGKAGSGKSTLMKFLTKHKTTPDILQHWAGSKRLVTASYYFWSAGNPMQKSQRGLLQSLLFQLLSQCPELIPVATPRRWNATTNYHSHPEPWQRDELSEALAVVLERSQLPVRFCFFIDGLDEYSGDYYDLTKQDQDARAEADHYELIRDLKNLARNPDVKLCLSSRPWNPFRKAFGEGKRKTLILEELTQADIAKYISGILEEDPRFVELAFHDEQAQELVSEIRTKAKGVFLWVFLAVRSLLRGLSEEDDIAELKRRIRRLPSDLREFFRRILHSIDPEYQELTCRLLALATYAAPLPLMAFWYLRIELDDPDYALKAKIEPFRSADEPKLKSSATASVNKWCRDLLEVQGFGSLDDRAVSFDRQVSGVKIAFLHRTVKDFLTDADVRRYIENHVGDGFDAPLSMCRMYLAQAKTRTRVMETGSLHWKWFCHFARSVLSHAKAYEIRNSSSLTDIMNELDQVGHDFRGPTWTDHIAVGQGNAIQQFRIEEQGKSNFLALAVSHDLTVFVSNVLKRRPEAIQKEGRPLIDYAIHPSFLDRDDDFVDRPIYAEMIRLLMSAGADINASIGMGFNFSVWQILLFECYHSPSSGILDGLRFRDIVSAFIEHGADIDCRVKIRLSTSKVPVANLSGSRETRMDLTGGTMVKKEYASVLECLSRVFGKDEATSILSNARLNMMAKNAPFPQHSAQASQGWLSWWMFWRER